MRRSVIGVAVGIALHCGVANAAPATETHTLKDHEDMAQPMYCVVSYVILWENIKYDGSVRSSVKTDIQSRGRGLVKHILSLAQGYGHNAVEVDQYAIWLHGMVSELPTDQWLNAAEVAGCRAMTNKYSTFGVL